MSGKIIYWFFLYLITFLNSCLESTISGSSTLSSVISFLEKNRNKFHYVRAPNKVMWRSLRGFLNLFVVFSFLFKALTQEGRKRWKHNCWHKKEYLQCHQCKREDITAVIGSVWKYLQRRRSLGSDGGGRGGTRTIVNFNFLFKFNNNWNRKKKLETIINFLYWWP